MGGLGLIQLLSCICKQEVTLMTRVTSAHSMEGNAIFDGIELVKVKAEGNACEFSNLDQVIVNHVTDLDDML